MRNVSYKLDPSDLFSKSELTSQFRWHRSLDGCELYSMAGQDSVQDQGDNVRGFPSPQTRSGNSSGGVTEGSHQPLDMWQHCCNNALLNKGIPDSVML